MRAPQDAHRERNRLLHAARVVPSVDDQIWTELLLAYLAAEDKALWILGDYLEGEGLERIRPGDIDQRLRYALGLLPPLLAHEISCDYIEHVLEPVEGPRTHRIRDGITIKRAWLQGSVSDADLKLARKTIQALPKKDFLVEAAAQALSSSPSPSVAQRTSLLAARAMGELQAGRYSTPSLQDVLRREVRWQVARLRERLELRSAR